MKTRLLLSCAALAAFFLTSASGQSNWQASAGLMQFRENDGPYDIELEAVYATLGYRIEVAPRFYIIPEATAGKGITEERLWGVDVEISHFLSVGARAQYEFESRFYVYGTLAWGELEVDTPFGSGSTDEIGTGIGLGYDLNDWIGAEFGYSVFDETDVLQLGVKFRF